MKIAVIGAGSTYTPELVDSLIRRKERLAVTELALMDIDEEKLVIVGGLAQRMAALRGAEMRCTLTRSLDEALAGCSYVIAQIRVGRLPARVLDEKIPLKHGLIGQETTGIGGLFKGLRTIPAVMDIASRMEKQCPGAWLVNFSNPSGMVAEAVLNHSGIRMAGLCNSAINLYAKVHRHFATQDLEIQYLGLNHLTWMTGIRGKGRDLLNEALHGEGTDSLGLPDVGYDIDIMRMAGGIPSYYLVYYYDRNAQLGRLRGEELTRGEVCMEIERDLLGLYRNTDYQVTPELLGKRGGSLYSEAAISLIDSLENGTADTHVVSLKNCGALDFMDDDDVVEAPARVGQGRAELIPVRGFQNRHVIGMMKTIKAYEKHAVNAALHGDRLEALRAMAIHPLIGDLPAAKMCFDEMLLAHRDHLPRFFR